MCEQQDIPSIDRAVADLNTAWNSTSEDMYKVAHGAQAESGTTGGESGHGADGDDATNVPFEEVK